MSLEVEPFFFGGPDQPLFGCYHPPRPVAPRRLPLLLCHPLGYEYVPSHRCFQQLATRLARGGFPVLRFDYFATGDSAGDEAEGRIARWLADIDTAIDVLLRRTRARQIGLVGLRGGATLAWIAAARRSEVTSHALWDPIVNGRDHLAELIAFQESTLLQYPKSYRRPHGERHDDIRGCEFPEDLEREYQAMDMLSVSPRSRERALLIVSAAEEAEPLRKHLESNLPGRLTFQHQPGPQIWSADPTKKMVPAEILDSIVTWHSQAAT
ncbi:MAG: hypothetical protein ACKV0T_01410 [Planctomycetales bacterium]